MLNKEQEDSEYMRAVAVQVADLLIDKLKLIGVYEEDLQSQAAKVDLTIVKYEDCMVQEYACKGILLFWVEWKDKVATIIEY